MRVPSTLPQHFQQAIQRVKPVVAAWSRTHPVWQWITAAEWFAAGRDARTLTTDSDVAPDEAFRIYIEKTHMPAVRLCRFGATLRLLPKIEGADEELAKMEQPHHFFHGEYALYLAVKIFHKERCNVRFVPTQQGRSGGTPDLEIPAARVCVECRAHEQGNPRQPLKEDFKHASGKFTQYPNDGSWTGVLAVDLGVLCSPSLPDVGRLGRSIPWTTADVDSYFPEYPNVAAFLLTWMSVDREENPNGKGLLVPKNVSGLRYAPSRSRQVSILDRNFRPWIEDPPRIAIRTAPTS